MRCSLAPLLVLAFFLALAPCVLAFDGGDLDRDGIVDETDMRIFCQAWKDHRDGTAVASLPGFEPNADINTDGDINHIDFGFFVDRWITVYKPTLSMAGYMTYNDGDQRYWIDSGSIYHWKDAVVGSSPNFAERHIPTVPAGETQDLWQVTGGTVTAEGLVVGGSTYTYATPMQLPDKLAQGVPVVLESDVMSGATKVGHMSLLITLMAMNQTVAMGSEHTWSGVCAKVQITKNGIINGKGAGDNRIVWLAPATGPVEEDTDPASPGTSMRTLQYLKVGATIYGTLPATAVAGRYPFAKGNTYILQGTEGTFGQKILDPKTVGGQSCGVQADFGLPEGDTAQYFTLSGGSASGFAGFKESHDDHDYVLNSAITFGTTWTMGDAIVGSGSVSYNGNPSYGTYSSVVCPVGIDVPVNAAGTVFEHCVVVDFRRSATKTGQTSPFEQDDTRVWLAPGVGPVQVADLGTTVTPTSVHTADAGGGTVTPAVYLKVGSTTYGTQPTVDWGSAMKLATNNAWGLSNGSPDSDPHVFACEAPETLGGVSCTPVTETWGGGIPYPNVSFLQSDHYRVTGTQVQWVGHRNDPDDQGYPLTFVMATPLSYPRTLALGESYVSPLTTANDASTGLPVQIGGQTVQIRMTVSFVGIQTSHNSILGTDFPGCSVVEKYLEIPAMSYAELYSYTYDANAGVVEYHVWKAGSSGMDYWLKWARVGEQTWGEASSLDVAELFPIATGNDWRLGPTSPSTAYSAWTVGTAESGGGYTGVFPVTKSNGYPQAPLDRFVTQGGQRLWVGFDYYTSGGVGPYPAWSTPAFAEPRPWPIGLAVRGSGTAAVGAPVNQSFQYRIVRVPVDFGLTVVTPAATFENCVAFAELLEMAPAGTTTSWRWKHFYTVYAPFWGPVQYWERTGQQGGTVEGTYSKYGLVQFAHVNGIPYP